MRKSSRNYSANNSGFTLAELLIVVAIILVLATIVFPIFTKLVESARESTDLANIRGAYAQVKAEAIQGNRSSSLWSSADGCWRVVVDLEQAEDNWQNDSASLALHGIAEVEGTPLAKGKAYVEYDPSFVAGKLNTTIRFDGPGQSGYTIDYGSTQSVGKYVYSQVLKDLELSASGQAAIFNDDFKNKTNDTSTTVDLPLPNGSTVKVVIYRRKYDRFDDIKSRQTEKTASLIYNRTTGKLSTIVYYENGKYSSWSVDGDSDAWSNDAAWKDNAY